MFEGILQGEKNVVCLIVFQRNIDVSEKTVLCKANQDLIFILDEGLEACWTIVVVIGILFGGLEVNQV